MKMYDLIDQEWYPEFSRKNSPYCVKTLAVLLRLLFPDRRELLYDLL